MESRDCGSLRAPGRSVDRHHSDPRDVSARLVLARTPHRTDAPPGPSRGARDPAGDTWRDHGPESVECVDQQRTRREWRVRPGYLARADASELAPIGRRRARTGGGVKNAGADLAGVPMAPARRSVRDYF